MSMSPTQSKDLFFRTIHRPHNESGESSRRRKARWIVWSISLLLSVGCSAVESVTEETSEGTTDTGAIDAVGSGSSASNPNPGNENLAPGESTDPSSSTGGVGNTGGVENTGAVENGGTGGAQATGGAPSPTGTGGTGSSDGSGAGGADPNTGDGSGGSSDGSCPNPMDNYDLSHIEEAETHSNYAVFGSTEQEIRESINQNRNSDYDAFTSWDLTWGYADCNGNGLVITLDVDYRLPEWQEPDDADPSVAEAWYTYTKALYCHESGHSEFGIKAALDSYEELSTIKTNGDCSLLKAEASERFNAVIDHYVEIEIQYDKDTNHGATQGAVFPAP